MSRILGISGSLRKASYNSALLRAAREIAPDVIEIGSIQGIPLYDGDLESEGVPPAVEDLKNRVAAADGLLLVTPEYNNSMPGVLKNAIDWLSRPSGGIRNVFRGKAVAVIGATPGNWGTLLSQNAWLPVWHSLGAELWSGGRLMVAGAGRLFDDEGKLVDGAVRERLDKFVRNYIEYVATIRSD